MLWSVSLRKTTRSEIASFNMNATFHGKWALTHTYTLSAPFISFEIRLICAQILTLILKLILYCIARESSNWLFVDMKFTALLFWVGFFSLFDGAAVRFELINPSTLIRYQLVLPTDESFIYFYYNIVYLDNANEKFPWTRSCWAIHEFAVLLNQNASFINQSR